MVISDLLNYDIKHLRNSGKIDCKFPKPGTLVVMKGATDQYYLFEILKILKGNRVVIWESSTSHTTTIPTADVVPIDSEYIDRVRKKRTREVIQSQILSTPLKRKNYLLKYLNKTLPKIYEEEHFDITSGEYKVYLTIHYPLLTIRNSTGQSHNITDFFVRFAFGTDNKLYLNSLDYARASFSELDILKNSGSLYIHSHLNFNLPCRWSNNFCYGNTVLGRTLDKFRDELDLRQFSTFLVNLEDTLKWESLEGGPFHRISSLGQGEEGSTGYISETIHVDSYCYAHLIKELKKLNSFPVFQYSSGNIKIPYKHRLHKIITEGYVNYPQDNFSPQLFEFDEENMRSINTSGNSFARRVQEMGRSQHYILFKGEKIKPKFTVVTDQKEDVEKLCHYSFYTVIIKKLEDRLKSSIVFKTLNNE